MPNNYNGSSAAAVYSDAVPIILDGEVWQYGNASSGVFGMIKPILDRIAHINVHGGYQNRDNTWTGTNLWNTGSFVFQDTLDHVGIFCPCNVDTGGVLSIKSGGELHVKSGGLATTESGGISKVEVGGAWNVFGTLATKASGLTTVESGGISKIEVGGNFNVFGTATIKTSGSFVFESASALAFDATTISGSVTRTGPTKQSGNDAYRGERLVAVSNTTTNVNAHRADVIFPLGVLAGNIVWTLNDPPDVTYQCRIRVVFPNSLAAGHTITMTDVSGSFSIAMAADTNLTWMEFIFSGPGVWFPCGMGSG